LEGDEIPSEPQDSAEAYINVKQYRSLKIDAQAPYLTIGYGESVDYFVSVQNTGNGADTIDLDHDAPVGWVVQLDAFKLNLDPQETHVIKFTLVTPSNPPLGEYKFTVNFTSSDNSKLVGKFTIYAYVEPEDRIVIAGGNLPVLITSVRELNLGKINTGDEKLIELNVRCYVQTTEVEIKYEVLKVNLGGYTPETNLTIEVSPSKNTISAGSQDTFNLKIISNKSNYPPSKLAFNEIIRVQAVSTEYSNIAGVDLNSRSNKLTFDFVVINTNPSKSDPHFLTTVTGAAVTSSLIVAAVVGAVAGGTEFGKYRFLSLLFVPLYTKIHKDKVLDHFTRGRVYEYIRNNPGSHYSLIKRELGLNNGGLTYHLRTLEREELIRARRVGIYKLFYTTKTQIPETIGLGLNELQKTIVESIRTNPGITQTEIGAKIPDKSQRTISHHIKTMERKGILVLEKDGRDTKCYIADTYEDDAVAAPDGKGSKQPAAEGHEIKPSDNEIMLKEI
jgi:DNA-binding transcriptional ArsR family regulator